MERKQGWVWPASVAFHFRTSCKRGSKEGKQVDPFAFKHYPTDVQTAVGG